MRKKRYNYTPKEKVFVLKRHLVERVAVSDLCDEYKLQPKVFYEWQKQFFENGTAAFGRDERSRKLYYGPQFIAKDFKEFIRISGMTHVKTSPFHPQSNSKLERFHKTIKHECIRPGAPISLGDARRILGVYIEHYNTVRLHSTIGYVAPADKLTGRDEEIFMERDRKLEEARERRKQKRQ